MIQTFIKRLARFSDKSFGADTQITVLFALIFNLYSHPVVSALFWGMAGISFVLGTLNGIMGWNDPLPETPND